MDGMTAVTRVNVEPHGVSTTDETTRGASRGDDDDAESASFTRLGPIFGSHVERIGLVRTLAGGLPMYLCIPVLVTIHGTSAVALYQWIVCPLLGTERLAWRDYIVIDRHRIEELTWFDKLNCMFCGYANGLVTLLNVELDRTAGADFRPGLPQKLLIGSTLLAYAPVWLSAEIALQVIYNALVSVPLGMHRTSIAEMRKVMDEAGYAKKHWGPLRLFLRATKSTVARFALGLEQIESSWCPLAHFERRKGVVYPKHHERFFGPDEIERMREALRTRGTVSERLPKY